MSAQPTGNALGSASPTRATQATKSQPRVTTATVWRELARQSFAILGHVNAAGQPRSSGVVYGEADRRLYVVVAPDGWKARDIATGDQVAVTVPVRRGGILTLLFPIPPATISFHARATIHPPGSLDIAAMSKDLAKLLPDPSHGAAGAVIELAPDGQFLTYGLGVSLMGMRDATIARAHVPVS